MKKWYLSTPMNGKTGIEIEAAILRGIDWVEARGESYHNPYNRNKAVFDDNDKVYDLKPIMMLAGAIEPMDDCTGVLFIGSSSEIGKSKGCRIEWEIAFVYDKERMYID